MSDLKISIEIDARQTKSGADTAKRELRGVCDEAEKTGRRISSTAKPDFSASIKAIKDYGNQIKQLRESAGGALDSFKGNLAANAVSFLSSTLLEGGKAILDYSAKLEQTKIGFTSLLGSGEKASQLLKEIQEFAKSTPFEFQGIAALSQRLLGANVEGKKIIPLMRDIGNVVAATGETSQERLEGVTIAITQMLGKGKVSAEEMEQLAERGVNGFQILSDATGKSQSELRKLAEDGKLSADVMVAALQKVSKEKFGDAMEKQSRTFSGAMSNVRDSVLIAANKYFEPLYQKISEISIRTADELENADFNKAIQILAKNFAKGLGEALAAELKYEWENFNWNDVFTPADLGASIYEGMFGNFNLYDYFTGNLKPEIQKIKFDVDKVFKGGASFNGAKYVLDPITNTLQKVKETVEKTPSLSNKLDADKAAADAKKLAKDLDSIALDLANKIHFFGDSSEVASAQQQLLSKGVGDFSTGAAKAIIAMAQMLDGIKANEKAQGEYNDRLKSAHEELEQLQADADFKVKFSNPTELDEFNYKVSRSSLEFRGLKSEIDSVRESLILLASLKEFDKAGEKSEGFIGSLKSNIESLNTISTTPFQDKINELLKGVELFTSAGEKLDNTGIAKAIEDKLLNQRNTLGLLNDWAANAIGDPAAISAALKVKSETAVNDWYADFTTFMRTIRQKVETDAGDGTKKIDYTAFFEGKEGNEATIIKFIELFNALETAKENAANVSFNDIVGGLNNEIADLNRQLADSGELSRADALAKQLQTDAYKNLTPEMTAALQAKAKEVDGLRAAAKAQDEYRETFEKTADVFEDALTKIFEGNWKGFFNGIFDEMKRFLIRATAELLASKFLKLLNPDASSSDGSSGGGFLQTILGSIKNLFNRGGSSPSNSTGSGANPYAAFLGNYQPDTNALNAGLPTGAINSAGQVVVNGSNSSSGGSFFGAQGFGNNVGTYSAVGGLASLVGGFIPGRVGGFISGAGSGLALGAQIGSLFGPGPGTLIGAVIGAAAGGLLSLFGGDPKRKKDKKENLPALQKGFTEALQQLRALGADKNAFYSDPEGTIAKALELRGQIASGFGIKFESKKYQKESQQQIAAKLLEADVIIADLQKLKDRAGRAKDVDTRLQTSFATGVYVRDDQMTEMRRALDFKRRNGMLAGTFTGIDTLPSMLAKGEMVLNPTQIQNVILNAGNDPFKGAGIPGYTNGIYISPSPSASPTATATDTKPSFTIQPTITVVIEAEGMTNVKVKEILVDNLKKADVQVEVVNAYDKGKLRTK